MRFKEVERLLEGFVTRKGFRVSFEVRKGGMLTSDHFPERDEKPFSTEQEAWVWAALFHTVAPKSVCSIYVVDRDWRPVPGYEEKVLRRR